MSSVRVVYYHFKDTPYYSLLLTVLTIVVCFFLVLTVVIPQVQDWFSVQREVAETRQRVRVLNENINRLNNLDKGVLDSHFDLASSALPPEKSFGPMLDSLSASAIRSGIVLVDFMFHVGTIATPSGETQVGSQKDLATVRLTVTMSGKSEKITAFLQEINEKLPLAEVLTVTGDEQLTAVTLQFFQKKYPLLTFKDDRPITPVSDTHTALLQKLNNWQETAVEIPVGTSSGAAPLF